MADTRLEDALAQLDSREKPVAPTETPVDAQGPMEAALGQVDNKQRSGL